MEFAQAFSMQTLHGNPICASAALAVLDTIRDENLTGRAAETGQYLMQCIEQEMVNQPLIGQVRGQGLAIGVELVLDDKKTPAADLARKTVYRAWELGAVFYYVGMQSNVLELTPPLTLTREEAGEGAQVLLQALEDASTGKVPDSAIAEFSGW
jgi:4-aminobutyrate aminotransferase